MFRATSSRDITGNRLPYQREAGAHAFTITLRVLVRRLRLWKWGPNRGRLPARNTTRTPFLRVVPPPYPSQSKRPRSRGHSRGCPAGNEATAFKLLSFSGPPL